MVEVTAGSAKMENSAAGRGNERRKSWLKDLIKRWRRSTSRRAAAGEPSHLQSTTADRQPDPLKSDTTEAISTADEPSGPSKSADMTADKPADVQPLAGNDTPLVADDGDLIPADDNIEALLPMVSLSQERAQKIFEKYGLKYESRNANTDPEPRDATQRVEKSIRIRIHWTCHDCNTSFGANKTCTSCEHRRCRECSRSPSKKVKDLLKKSKEQDEQETKVPSAASAVPGTVIGAEDMENATSNTVPGITSAAPESRRQQLVPSEDDVDATQQKYIIQTLPRSAIEMVLEPTAQTRDRTTSEQPGQRLHNDGILFPQEPKMVATVQRVFRKPRQRVRWSCHECETMFFGRDPCRGCGHERCKACIRSPPKRIPQPPDPAVLQSVNDKLAQLHVQPPIPTPGVVAAAG
ncbi:hypothetical protein LTR37_003317 [Vermiconidia calcicola]|uniref:Uncharacterized protein n=1 Tax=Vermiconidia calcicola TaxID=1690605 RepID=A0ACC3NPX0_9PEZI|nr:hypothetical protein LTR37_003317 [Vermiconidia calcicola]